jgi:hypothetical protein
VESDKRIEFRAVSTARGGIMYAKMYKRRRSFARRLCASSNESSENKAVSQNSCKCSISLLPRSTCSHMMPLDFKIRMAATTPPTKSMSPTQNAQHIHVRCFLFRRWPSSQESLFDGSAVTLVQNLKREGGRPDKPMVRLDELL